MKFLYSYKYPKSLNTPELHRHIIWASPFFIKKYTIPGIYIDGTFVHPDKFKQILIILCYDDITKKRYPGANILINSKYEQTYIISLNSLKNIITKNYNLKFN